MAVVRAAGHGLIVVTVPRWARPVDGRAVVAMVAQAVRAVVAQPADAADTDGADASPPGPPEEPIDAVVAAHDARIAILRQRLAALDGTKGAAQLLDDLTRRLHRAEAARRLAVARAGGDPAPASACRPDASWSCGDRPVVVAATRADAPRPPLPRSVARTSHSRSDARAGAPSYRMARQAVIVPPIRPTSPHRRALAVTPAPLFAAAMPPTRVTSGSGIARAPAAVRLAAAHRSLAMARALLGAAPTARPTPFGAITGLWRWEGSDSWALRPDLT